MSLRPELEFALHLARDCGSLALRYHRGDRDALAAEEKADGGGLVTRADTEVEKALVRAIRDRFPADAVLAEESAEDSDRRLRARCWMIDPIDGTREFAAGDPSWAIHIGLCVEGEPVVGVVAQPSAGRISYGIASGPDAGAWLETAGAEPSVLRASDRGLERIRLVSSKSHESPRTRRILEILDVDDGDHLRMGSTGVKISKVAAGDADVYAHPTRGTKLWDSCAPQALIVGAGGRLTDLCGAPLCYVDDELENMRGLLASNGRWHAEIAARLSDSASEWFPTD